jgi:co-chaperonin GroES (HSP10)
VGSGPRRDGKITPLDVKAGDRILFGKWSGTEVTIDGEELIIMKEATSSASSTVAPGEVSLAPIPITH